MVDYVVNVDRRTRTKVGAMKPLARRSILGLPSTVGMSALLTACIARSSKRAKAGSNVTGTSQVPQTTKMPNGAISFSTTYLNKDLNVEVGPVTVRDDKAVARIRFSTDSADPVSLFKASDDPDHPYSMVGMRLLSLEDGLVFPELNTSAKALGGSVSGDKKLTIFPVFKDLKQRTKSVSVFTPNMGIALNASIVNESDFGQPVDKVLSEAVIDETNHGPFSLESVVVGPDANVDIARNQKTTTVNISGDVTFSADSADLSGQADAVLATVADQFVLYPSGGEVKITGHTDDVADDAYNLRLSERRAEAVSNRLKALVDMSRWKVSTAGLGESYPRVSNDSDKHRQLNRRVEIKLLPIKPDEATSALPSSTPSSPAGVSADKSDVPTGKRKDGVDVELGNSMVHFSAPSVTRVGNYLCGPVLLKATDSVVVKKGSFELPAKWGAMRQHPGGWAFLDPVGNLTLMKEDYHYLPAEYTGSNGGYLPLTNLVMADLVAGDTRYLPVVWSDLGEDVVTLDFPGGVGTYGSLVSARLTDIPVVDA